MMKLIVRISILLAWFVLPAQAAQSHQTRLLLPDLQTLPPFDLQLIHHPASGVRVLRFSNSVANTGAGPLDLLGTLDPKTHEVTLDQQVHRADGHLLTQRLSGFAYHPEHYHWHWEGFSVYEIWSLDLYAELDEPLLNSGKVGYCMMDIRRVEADWLASHSIALLAPSPDRAYRQCGWRRQGISAGWVDTYERHLPGQEIDVSPLADGVYALRSTVNPDGLLLEADRTNNAALVYFHLEGPRLTVLEDARFARARLIRSLYGEEGPQAPARWPAGEAGEGMR